MTGRLANFSRSSRSVVVDFVRRLAFGFPLIVQNSMRLVMPARFCFGCGSAAHTLSTCDCLSSAFERGCAESCAFRTFSMKAAEELLFYSKAVTPTAYAEFRRANPLARITFETVRDMAILHGWAKPIHKNWERPSANARAGKQLPAKRAAPPAAAQRSPLLPDPVQRPAKSSTARQRRRIKQRRQAKPGTPARNSPRAQGEQGAAKQASPQRSGMDEDLEYMPATPTVDLDAQLAALDGLAELKRKARSPLSAERPRNRVRISEIQRSIGTSAEVVADAEESADVNSSSDATGSAVESKESGMRATPLSSTRVRISAISPKAAVRAIAADASASSSSSAQLVPIGSPPLAVASSQVVAANSQRAKSSNGQLAPEYEKWTLHDYASRNVAGRAKFWENAPPLAAKAMVRMILELAQEHPTRKQALEKGWLAEEEKVN